MTETGTPGAQAPGVPFLTVRKGLPNKQRTVRTLRGYSTIREPPAETSGNARHLEDSDAE